MISSILSIFQGAPAQVKKVEPSSASRCDLFKKYGSTYREVFDRQDGQREEFRAFLRNIFMQLDEDKFFTLIDSILEDPDLSDEEIYAKLSKRIGEASPGFFQKIFGLFRSLGTLKEDLSSQVQTLMGDKRNIDGYMEIGYPGRMIRPIQGKFTMTGPRIVVNDRERASDYVQTGFGPRPYQKFIELGDFTPISETQVPSNSLDMVTCFIGLHHTPTDKLDEFIESIKRVLKPGGSFILMDHDASTEKMRTLVNVVHSVFNAATGATAEEERQEVREFDSLQHWTNLLERHGLELQPGDPLVREGDSTQNSLIRFVKPAGILESANASELDPQFRRDQIQTFLTAVEWHNVRLYQAYGAYLEHTAAYYYPYMSEIGKVWQVFADSWNAARKYGSFSEVAFNMYTVMNVLLCLYITVEFFFKSLYNAPAYLLYGVLQKEDLTIHLQVKNDGRNLTSVDERVQVVEDGDETRHIVIPRFLPCTEILRKFAEEGIDCVTIAGQKKVMIDFEVEKEETSPIDETEGCKKLYEIPPPTGYLHKVIAYAVDVSELGSVLRSVDDRVVKKVFVHDF